MTDIVQNIAGWAIIAGMYIYGGAIMWLHIWLRQRERDEIDDEGLVEEE